MKTSHSSPSGQNHNATSPASGPNAAAASAVVVLSSLPLVLPPAPPPVPAPDPEADQWATKINEAVGKGLGWILDAGRHLIEAKAALLHGRWTAMFESGRIKFSMRYATSLIRIAEHRALSNQRNLADLPHCLTTLDVLAGGSAEIIEAGIKAGAIGPELTAKEAKSFLRAQSPKLITRRRAPKFDAAKRLKHLDAVLWTESEKWPDEALGQFVEKLATFAEELRSYDPPAQP